MKKTVLLLVLAGLLVMVTGCSLFKPTIKTDKGEVTLDKNKIEVKGNDGSSSQVAVSDEEGTEVALPEGYPNDIVPVIDGGKVLMASKNEDQNKKLAFSVVIDTENGIQQVVDFYKDVMKGSKNLTQTTATDGGMIAGEKGNYQVLIIVSTKDEDGKKLTTAAVTLSPKQQ